MLKSGYKWPCVTLHTPSSLEPFSRLYGVAATSVDDILAALDAALPDSSSLSDAAIPTPPAEGPERSSNRLASNGTETTIEPGKAAAEAELPAEAFVHAQPTLGNVLVMKPAGNGIPALLKHAAKEIPALLKHSKQQTLCVLVTASAEGSADRASELCEALRDVARQHPSLLCCECDVTASQSNEHFGSRVSAPPPALAIVSSRGLRAIPLRDTANAAQLLRQAAARAAKSGREGGADNAATRTLAACATRSGRGAVADEGATGASNASEKASSGLVQSRAGSDVQAALARKSSSEDVLGHVHVAANGRVGRGGTQELPANGLRSSLKGASGTHSVGTTPQSRFDPPSKHAKAGATRTFPGKGKAEFWPKMPCLRCGCPWWSGEDWDAKCVRCGWCCESEGYDDDSEPLKKGGWQEKYDEFSAYIREGRTAPWPPR